MVIKMTNIDAIKNNKGWLIWILIKDNDKY